MKRTIQTVEDIVGWRLCVGCGACKSVSKEYPIELANIDDAGIRPYYTGKTPSVDSQVLKICPGLMVGRYEEDGVNVPWTDDWGPILDVWEGYAADEQIRFSGSSGGAATALALYCTEKFGMSGVIHIGEDSRLSLQNRTYISTSREEIVKHTGSRYAPASPCDVAEEITAIDGKWAFIGKPCDIAGMRNRAVESKLLKERLGCLIGIFCAGTPSTKGTKELIRGMGVDPAEVKSFRYRGNGWPGKTAIVDKSNNVLPVERTYKESWGFLQKYRPFRCYLCPDGTSEAADISCGDPWYRKIGEDENGMSLVIARTKRGQEVISGAISEGYLYLEKRSTEIIAKSQPNLIGKRGSIWGRMAAMRIFGLPVPEYQSVPLFRCWMRLSAKDKIKSFTGTIKRIVGRKYFFPERIQ